MWITLSRYPHPNTTNNNNNWIGNPFRITFSKLLTNLSTLFRTSQFATGETVKNSIYLIINKLQIVIKSKTKQTRNSRRKRAAIKR